MQFNEFINVPEVKKLRFFLANPSSSNIKLGFIPLGLAYLAAILEANGVKTLCANYTVEDYKVEELKKTIVENDINIVGLSGFTPHIFSTYEIIKTVKEINPRIKVIVGGPHPTILPNEALDHGADIVIRGEAESVLYRLLPHLYDFNLDEIAKIEGVCFRKDGQTVNTGMPKRIIDLDDLPFPARHLFKYFPEKYGIVLPLNLTKNWRVATIFTSRGCSAHCVFCNKQVFGSKITYRSPENIMEEIHHLVDRYKINEVSMSDDFFTSDVERVKKICRLIMDSNLGIKWSCSNTRVDVLDEDMFRMMKESGCYRISFGIESGVQRVIDSIKKGITLEQVNTAIDFANKYKFQIIVNFMIGHYHETIDDIYQTIRYAKKIKVDIVQFGICTPFPGTPVYRWIKRDGNLLTEDWRDYDYSSKVIFRTKTLSPEVILKMYNKAWKEVTIYNPAFIARHIRRFLFDKNISRRQYLTVGFSELCKRIFLKKWL